MSKPRIIFAISLPSLLSLKCMSKFPEKRQFQYSNSNVSPVLVIDKYLLAQQTKSLA